MPKITLLNNATGKLQDFEPVDAREVLQMKDPAYSVPTETQDGIGVQAARLVNIPQLQGDDAEMQVGLSVEKYGRADIVKAQIGMPVFGDGPVAQTTLGVPISTATQEVGDMTVIQLKAALDDKGVTYSPTARKADLQAMYDKA